MQKLQCELCGSVDIIRMDNGLFQCQHCGCKYTAEQAKAMLGTVETTIGKAECERLLKNAKTYYDLEQYSEAEKTYAEATKQFPHDYRGWLGLMRMWYRNCMSSTMTPDKEVTMKLQNYFNICQKLCDSKTITEITREWENFWNRIANLCRSGKQKYCGGCNPELFKDTSPAMYELSKAGLKNAEILNSMDAYYGEWIYDWYPDGWYPNRCDNKSKHSYTYCLGRSAQSAVLTSSGATHYTNEIDEKYRIGKLNLPVLDDVQIAKIKAEVQENIKYIVGGGKCPYCGVDIKKTIFGKKCPICGRKF